MIKGLAQELSEAPLLSDLDPAHLELIAGCSVNVAFAEGERVLRAGDPADHFWVIRRGRVDVEVDGGARGTIVIERLDPGEILGASWIAEPYRTEFDATAIERSSAIKVDAECLRNKCRADPRLGHELYRRFATLMRDRLHATRLQLLDVYRPAGT